MLIATILSAQCTDERVNLVTKELFKKYRTAADYADAKPEDLEEMIRSAGFYRMKAKNIQACCRALVDDHGGEVPKELAALVLLGGVGRKTANVVLGTAFGIPSGVVVDTHVTRLTGRLGLTRETDAVKIEEDMIALPPEEWIDFSHRLIWHGRKICTARKPLCRSLPAQPAVRPRTACRRKRSGRAPAGCDSAVGSGRSVGGCSTSPQESRCRRRGIGCRRPGYRLPPGRDIGCRRQKRNPPGQMRRRLVRNRPPQ